MALINAGTIIRSICLFHITLGFFFLTSPHTVADQTLVFIMGEAMGLPHVRAFDSPSPPLAFLGVVLAIWGFSDLIAVSQPEEIANHYWSSQAPIRLVLFFALAGYSYLFSAKSPMYKASGYISSSWGEGLKNRVLFTWAFVEMITWFWVWTTLREERRDMLVKAQEKRAQEDDRL
ncbi:hypothetical protein VE02_02889 [Pseudogymnoascus sp. 03VT05]|nr:hypothetical protein VE02_02889 [Pseudogymnoascus sp. 03VT05]